MAFNKLTDAQVERLAILSEELGEVQQVIGKILRHGYDSHHPEEPFVSNRDLLENELGDVRYAMTKLVSDGEISLKRVLLAHGRKALKVKKYLHHNEE